MKITKENNELVLRIPLEQPSYDAIGELIGTVPNLIGVIDRKNRQHSISHLNDLGYKGDQQEGMPIIDFWADEEGLRNACKELGLDIWES
jgi:hypothetical protein